MNLRTRKPQCSYFTCLKGSLVLDVDQRRDVLELGVGVVPSHHLLTVHARVVVTRRKGACKQWKVLASGGDVRGNIPPTG